MIIQGVVVNVIVVLQMKKKEEKPEYHWIYSVIVFVS